MLTLSEKTVLVNALKAVRDNVLDTLAASTAGTLGKQIADLDPATNIDAEIVAAYDAYKAFRLTNIDALVTTIVTEGRASV